MTGQFNQGKYEGFSKILETLNDEAQRSNSLSRFLDGYSPDEIWAVKSLGIDPSTGKEVFKKKNGEPTYVYDPEDIMPLGNARPVVEGIISSNLNIKGFLFGVNLRYSIGNNMMNSTLLEKVEINSQDRLKQNQDKRALYDRWRQPGDQAKFKALNSLGAYPITSRFIQKEHFILGESFNVGYEFTSTKHRWLDVSGVRTLRLNAYTNDLFRGSNVRTERGTAYPFSRSFALSMNIYFK